MRTVHSYTVHSHTYTDTYTQTYTETQPRAEHAHAYIDIHTYTHYVHVASSNDTSQVWTGHVTREHLRDTRSARFSFSVCLNPGSRTLFCVFLTSLRDMYIHSYVDTNVTSVFCSLNVPFFYQNIVRLQRSLFFSFSFLFFLLLYSFFLFSLLLVWYFGILNVFWNFIRIRPYILPVTTIVFLTNTLLFLYDFCTNIFTLHRSSYSWDECRFHSDLSVPS